jgi:hypothetical protein
MRERIIAVAAGIAVMVGVVGLSAEVTDEPPVGDDVTATSGEATIVERAVELIAPTLSGGDCPDVAAAAPRAAVDAADRLVFRARRNPDAEVPSPDGSGVDIPLSEVPAILADEVDGCILQAESTGTGWERIASTLRR